MHSNLMNLEKYVSDLALQSESKSLSLVRWVPLLVVDCISIAASRNNLSLDAKSSLSKNLIYFYRKCDLESEQTDNVYLNIIYLQIFNALNKDSVIGLMLLQIIIHILITSKSCYRNSDSEEDLKVLDVISACGENIDSFIIESNVAVDMENFSRAKYMLYESLKYFYENPVKYIDA